jgi:hypothetical protein
MRERLSNYQIIPSPRWRMKDEDLLFFCIFIYQDVLPLFSMLTVKKESQAD